MKNILVPTDFSQNATNAVDFSVQSSKILQAKITLLHAFELTGNMYTDYMGVNREFTQSMLNEVHHKLTQLKSSIEEKEGIIVDTAVYKSTVTQSILQVTSDKNIDFIVMGTLGASGIKEKLWGSETGSIIGKTKVPVIAVPFEYKWKKPEKILLLTNYFEKEPAIVNFLLELSNLFKAELHIAVFTDEDDPAINILEHGRNISQYEMLLKERYQQHSLTAKHLFGADFEKTLQNYISEKEIDMIAMVTYKKTFLDRIFHPSMTKRMSYHTKIPLLTIPGNKMIAD